MRHRQRHDGLEMAEQGAFQFRKQAMGLAQPDDAAFILEHCPMIDGFYGASSMERLPTERAIRQ
jgi:predicted TIM-barrel enzyme